MAIKTVAVKKHGLRLSERSIPVATLRANASNFKRRFAFSRIPRQDPPSDPLLRGLRKSARPGWPGTGLWQFV